MMVRWCSRAMTAAAASPRAKFFRRRAEEAAMLLAINANNTNTVFAFWEGADLKGSWRTATAGKRTADEYVAWLDHLLALEGLARANADGALIATVAPAPNLNLLPLPPKHSLTHPH